jgi:Fe-S-cluster containining protein
MGLPSADAELVQIVDAAFADAARRAGPRLVCRPGCTQCCHGVFAINALDAERLSTGMEILRAGNSALAGELERRARAWLDEHGAAFPGDPRTGILGETDAERARFDEYANQAACPALDPATGFCDVYAWRPMTCRVFGPPVRIDPGPGAEDSAALGHCELCFAGASTAEVAACEMSLPHELEQSLLAEIPTQYETIVAFALLGRCSHCGIRLASMP